VGGTYSGDPLGASGWGTPITTRSVVMPAKAGIHGKNGSRPPPG
jgi:hypothetical protein